MLKTSSVSTLYIFIKNQCIVHHKETHLPKSKTITFGFGCSLNTSSISSNSSGVKERSSDVTDLHSDVDIVSPASEFSYMSGKTSRSSSSIMSRSSSDIDAIIVFYVTPLSHKKENITSDFTYNLVTNWSTKSLRYFLEALKSKCIMATIQE